MKSTKNKGRIENRGQIVVNATILVALGVFLFVFWINNNNKIDYSDLHPIKGELISYDYREWSSGRGVRAKYIFVKIKGYECEFSSNADFNDFKNALRSSNVIETYIDHPNFIKLEKGLKEIQCLGLSVNNTTLERIDNALRERNFMMKYGILILGFGAFLFGSFEFIRLNKIWRNK